MIPRAAPLAMDDSLSPLRPPPPDDEAGLIADLRAGRPRAAERLAEATYARLYAGCHRMTGSAEEAKDLVQETYRKAWRALPEFRGDARFSTWLFRIAWTTHAKTLRRPRLAGAARGRARREASPTHDPSPEATRRRQASAPSRLRQAVAGLPEDLRYPVVAHYWAELPVREIAASEGITPVAVRKRLARAFRAPRRHARGEDPCPPEPTIETAAARSSVSSRRFRRRRLPAASADAIRSETPGRPRVGGRAPCRVAGGCGCTPVVAIEVAAHRRGARVRRRRRRP